MCKGQGGRDWWAETTVLNACACSWTSGCRKGGGCSGNNNYLSLLSENPQWYPSLSPPPPDGAKNLGKCIFLRAQCHLLSETTRHRLYSPALPRAANLTVVPTRQIGDYYVLIYKQYYIFHFVYKFSVLCECFVYLYIFFKFRDRARGRVKK